MDSVCCVRKLFNFPFYACSCCGCEWGWDRTSEKVRFWSHEIFSPYTRSSYELDMYRSWVKISTTPMLSMKIFMPNIFTLEQWLCCTAAGVSPTEFPYFSIEAGGAKWRWKQENKKIKNYELNFLVSLSGNRVGHQSRNERAKRGSFRRGCFVTLSRKLPTDKFLRPQKALPRTQSL